MDRNITRRDALKIGAFGVAGACTTALVSPEKGYAETPAGLVLPHVEASITRIDTKEKVFSLSNNPKASFCSDADPTLVVDKQTATPCIDGYTVTTSAKLLVPEEVWDSMPLRATDGYSRDDGVARLTMNLTVDWRGGSSGKNEIRISYGNFSAVAYRFGAFFNGRGWGLCQAAWSAGGEMSGDYAQYYTGWDYSPWTSGTDFLWSGGMVGGEVAVSGMSPYLLNLQHKY